MCGRYSLAVSPEKLAEYYMAEVPEAFTGPRYNVAPSQSMPILTNAQPDSFQMARWGLVPFWAKDPSIGNKMINARAETLMEKPAFSRLLERKRCLVPSDGFFEWKKVGKSKRPYRFTLGDGELFSFAGLWDTWKMPDGQEMISYTIITSPPNDLVKEYHDRMAVVLPKEKEPLWLQEDASASELENLLQPISPKKMEVYPVPAAMGSPSFECPEAIRPDQQGLFPAA